MDTKEVVDKYFQFVNAGDWDSWLSLFDDNIVMDEQLAGHVEGIEILRGAVGGLKRGYSKFQNNPLKMVINGENAMVMWKIDAANAKGVPIEAKGVNYFVINNGKITYMANFHDSVPFKPFLEQKFD